MTARHTVHIKIPSSDLQHSGSFYRDLFGRKITQDAGDELRAVATLGGAGRRLWPHRPDVALG
ncbi:MAG: VOC family protein [Anaerolineales bacterium]